MYFSCILSQSKPSKKKKKKVKDVDAPCDVRVDPQA